MVVTVGRAGPDGTIFARETSSAVAFSVNTFAMVIAVVWAGGNLAGVASPPLPTVARAIGAEPMTVASIGAFGQRTVEPRKPGIALTGPVHTNTAVGAIAGACMQ